MDNMVQRHIKRRVLNRIRLGRTNMTNKRTYVELVRDNCTVDWRVITDANDATSEIIASRVNDLMYHNCLLSGDCIAIFDNEKTPERLGLGRWQKRTDGFAYAVYRTREKAEAALEEMFAIGEIVEGEQPSIELRHGRYAIVLNYWCSGE